MKMIAGLNEVVHLDPDSASAEAPGEPQMVIQGQWKTMLDIAGNRM